MTHLSLRFTLQSNQRTWSGLLIALSLLLSPLALALNTEAKAAFNHGQMAKKKSAWERAERHYQRARELEPTWSKPLEALIRLRLDGNLSQAPLREELNAFIKLKPGSYKVSLFEGRCAHQQGRHQEAIQAYSKVLEARPRTLSALVNRADIHLLINRPELALRDYEEVLTLRPQHRDALWGKLLALVGINDWKSAHELANRLAAKDPTNIALRNLQARASRHSGLPPPPAIEASSRVYRELPPSDDVDSDQK